MSFSAALFAGGRSRRMQQDKAGLLVDGRPLWQRQIAILRAAGAAEIFVSGPARPAWREAGVAVVEDEKPDFGPLAGLVSTLRRAAHPHLLVLAVDMPAMTAAFLKKLVASADERVGAVPKIGESYEPLAAIYPVAARILAGECLQRGVLAMQAFVSQAVALGLLREFRVAAHERPLFVNVNTPRDLAAFRAGAAIQPGAGELRKR